MNRLELENKRLENYHKLDVYAFRPKYNAVELDINNSIEHELAKFMCVWLIRNGVSAIELQDIFDTFKLTKQNYFVIPSRLFMEMKEDCDGFKYQWERPVVITEARFKGNLRRTDIYILDTGEKVEIETNHKVKKEDSITVYI